MQNLFASKTVVGLRQLINYIDSNVLFRLWFLLPVSILSGFLDFAAVAVIGRLTGSLVGSDLANILPGIKVFGASIYEQSLWLIAIFIIVNWLQSVVRLTLRLMQENLAGELWLDLSGRIYNQILAQPYESHLSGNVTSLASDLLSNLEALLRDILTPSLRAASCLISIVMLVTGILYVGGGASFVLIVSMLLMYVALSYLITPTLRVASKLKIIARERYTKSFFESLGSIADLKLGLNEQYFISQYIDATQTYKKSVVNAIVFPEIPRLFIEPLGISAIFLVGVLPQVLSGQQERIIEVLPFLSVLAVGALRLAKPLQDLFASVSILRGGLPEINNIISLVDKTNTFRQFDIRKDTVCAESIFPLRSIRLVDVHYTYPGSSKPVLNGINIDIPVGSRIAFVGPSGSGKTTAANILLSLLRPQKGTLSLDGIPLLDNEIPAWYKCCAKVPQSIQLLSASVVANVAFGEMVQQIDEDKVWEALRAAQLDEIVSEMPYGIYSPIGDNGIGLSGGQRQRLALARSFYRQAKVLVLDEATSALDNQTESEVIQSLEIIGRRCTTLVIAHRLSTIIKCDRIYEFSDGKIIASGNFDQLRELSPTFRNMIELQSFNA
ncbi:ABC transporter ATP-binding protein [Synechococcus sp. MU1642]|uniref:ABC transporter ATP-binding protein n=1 Tax=Synechococcus sp. MU1642 TaxID=2508348 RepID=UPI001CF90663|nr:ABC transporter ATP-binding protein [Synechococcus sp. MU1642]